MSVFIEGVDNSGKSKLAARLRKDMTYLTGYPYDNVHSPGPLDRGEGMVNWLRDQLAIQQPGKIFDRISVISDTIYSPILRNAPSYYSLKTGLFTDVLAQLVSLPHMLIYCRPPEDIILDNGDRDQLEGVLENHRVLLKRYDALIGHLHSNCPDLDLHYYDYTEDEGTHYSWILDRAIDIHFERVQRLTKIEAILYQLKEGDRQ